MLYTKISKPVKGRRFVIPDIHGCCKTFQALVKEKIKLTQDDHLYLLGDYIDRGPDSKGVLDFIMALKDEFFQVFALRGNHEQSLLEDWHYYSKTKTVQNFDFFVETLQKNNTADLLDGQGRLIFKYYHFLRYLPFYYELDDFYLVHAGFNLEASQTFKHSKILIRCFGVESLLKMTNLCKNWKKNRWL